MQPTEINPVNPPRIRIYNILDYVALHVTTDRNREYYVLLDAAFYAANSHRPIYVDTLGGIPYARFSDTRQLLHREVAGLQPGDGRIAHHTALDSLDNRRASLKIMSRADHLAIHQQITKFFKSEQEVA